MTELKRPEIKKADNYDWVKSWKDWRRIESYGSFGDDPDEKVFSRHNMICAIDEMQDYFDFKAERTDSFLSDCASELERARELREQSYKYDLDGLVKQAREKEKSASQIENKVIQALKGDKK